MKEVKKIRNLLKIHKLDGYIIPKNDEFFGEYVPEIKDKCLKGSVKDPGHPFKNLKNTDTDIDNSSMSTSVKIMIGTGIQLIIGLLILIIIQMFKRKR